MLINSAFFNERKNSEAKNSRRFLAAETFQTTKLLQFFIEFCDDLNVPTASITILKDILSCD